MEFDFDTFGSYIKQIREDRGLTQIDIAEEIGYCVQHINKVERGRERPGIPFMKAYLDFFGLELKFVAVPKGEKNETNRRY